MLTYWRRRSRINHRAVVSCRLLTDLLIRWFQGNVEIRITRSGRADTLTGISKHTSTYTAGLMLPTAGLAENTDTCSEIHWMLLPQKLKIVHTIKFHVNPSSSFGQTHQPPRRSQYTLLANNIQNNRISKRNNLFVLSGFCEIVKSDFSFVTSTCPSVRPSDRMEKFGFYCVDFLETGWWGEFIQKNTTIKYG